jgi:hypothetical protein
LANCSISIYRPFSRVRSGKTKRALDPFCDCQTFIKWIKIDPNSPSRLSQISKFEVAPFPVSLQRAIYWRLVYCGSEGSAMKSKLILFTLLFVFLSSYQEFADHQVMASNSALIPRVQQGQQGLSPEKKKTLPSFGPDDIFPESVPAENTRRNREPDRPRQAAKTTVPAPAQAQATKPSTRAIAPSLDPVAPPASAPSIIESTKAPVISESIPVVPRQRTTYTPPSGWSLLVMSFLTLMIFVGLIYVLQKLKEKLLPSNSR